MEPRITPEEVEHYRREGYLRFTKPVLPEAEFAALTAKFEEILDEQTAAGVRPEAIDKPHFAYPELFRWVLSDPVLDLVEPILGPDFLLFSTHFICKPQGDGRRVPWHEDSAYWKGGFDPMEALTVWLAIDRSSPENGGMYVVPRTHREGQAGFSDYEGVETTESVFPTEIVRYQRREMEAIPMVLEPNQASLHDAKLIHGSPPNASDRRRCGFTMRFVPGNAKMCEAWYSFIGFYPARGRDLAGNRLLDPSRAYPELAGAVNRHKVH